MKVLIWDDHNGKFQASKKDQAHPIHDISEKDVLAIMRLILDGTEEVEMDPVPTNTDNVNQAALVIYEELYKQFLSMISKRDGILDQINKQFKEAESYYAENEIQDLFDMPGDVG
jgi:hypothetical protein